MKRIAVLSIASLSGCFFLLDFHKPLACGDGILTTELGEECDDGNTSAANGLEDFNDHCEATCTIPVCGDGIQQSFATLDANGDGIINFNDPFEQCDDGNNINDDECSNACRIPQCGDGIQQTVPTIDTDNDGVADTAEECDDGFTCLDGTACEPNTQCADLSFCQVRGGDGCAQNCVLEVCGNGTVDVGEECDDGNNIDADGCEADCTDPACANGILDPGEVCFTGDFQTPVLNIGGAPTTVIADLDNDQNLDLALVNLGDLHVFFGNGDGTFEPTPATVSDPENLATIAVGDFDGDQLPDLIAYDTVVAGNGTAILFSKNNGNRTFGNFVRSTQNISNNSRQILVGDLNGDSILDITDPSRFANDRFFLGVGNGTFTVADYTFAPTNVLNSSADRAVGADFDGDQDLDLIFFGGSSVFFLAINEAPALTFTTQTLSIANDLDNASLADFNGDGLIDLAGLSFSSLQLMENQGGTTLGTTITTNVFSIDTVHATDFDLDGTSEMLLLDGSSNFANAFIFDGVALTETTFSPFSGGIVQSPVFADINEDGIQDMVFQQNNITGGVYLFLGTP